jgi:poly(A) polymerase
MPLPNLSKAKWLRDPLLRRLLAVLAQEGEGRVVGGAVRNELMGLPVQDIDIATDLVPQTVVRLCKAAGFGVHLTGIDHGTLTITVEGKPYEVTTLRKDIETDGRRAVVAFTSDWKTDAFRRDFTFNALYVDGNGNIHDFTDGWRDVQRRKVRFIGSASLRIKEDYLRILRFFRFHAQLGKGPMDATGLAACKRLAKGLETLSAERIRQEMLKLLAAPGAIPVVRKMADMRILTKICPHTEDWRVLKRLPADPVLRLAALSAHPLELGQRLRLSNKEATRIAKALDAPLLSPDLSTRERHRLLYQLGDEVWRDAVYLSWAKSRAAADNVKWKRLLGTGRNWHKPTFPVNGLMLIKLGVAPGPALGQALRDLEDWWVASDFKPSAAELLDYHGTRT